MFEKIYAAWRLGRARARAITELRAMSPRLLEDVGIRPDQIEDFVEGRRLR